MHPNDLLANSEWTLVQRGRRRRTPRDPHYPPPLMNPSAWAAPAPEARFSHFDNRHERLWAPRHPSPRRWEQHARPGRDWSPYGPARHHHHEGWSEAYRPAYSPPRRPAYSPPRRPAYSPPRRPAYSPPRRETQRPPQRRAPETRRAPRHPAWAPGPPAGPRRTRPQVRPPPPRPDPRPRDRPRPPRRPEPPVATAARTGSARPLPPREAPRAPAAQLSDDPDFSLKNRLITTMRRSNASVADPYRRDWEPRDPSPRGWGYHTRPTRGWSPLGSARYPPALLNRAYRPAPSPRRHERRRGGANERQVFHPAIYDRDLPTNAPRTRHQADPDFALKNRLILAAIKATHHLVNATGSEPLPVIARLAASLMASIRPAVPNAATLALLEGNARNWAHTTSIILRDHYRATVVQKVSALSSLADPAWRHNFEVAASWVARQYRHHLRQETLDSLRSELRQELDTRAPLDALRDGSLPPSGLPPPSSPPAELPSDLRLLGPDPGTLDCDGRANRSPSRTSSVSLFSFPSSPPPPLLPPAGSRPPLAAPLPQTTTRTSAKPRRRTLATPLWSAPASPGTTPPNGSAQTSARWDAVPAGTSLGSARPSPALPLPQRKPRPSGSFLFQPLTTPLPATSASGSTHALFQPLTTPLPTTPASGSTRARMIFAPPADGVTPDTPTRRPTRHTKMVMCDPIRAVASDSGHAPSASSCVSRHDTSPCVCPDAQTSASALPRRWTLAMPLQPATPADSVRAQQTFNPPADSVTLDTPTRVSIKRVSTAIRSRVTSDPPADDVTPMAHTRMFSRRANTARRLARKLCSAAPPQRGSSTEASP
ncbi:unnamed protein product [Arctogadus glacialis]